MMPFELKNIGAYQRLVNQMFKEQIRHEEELYIDELLIKSKEPKQQIDDLREVFVIL